MRERAPTTTGSSHHTPPASTLPHSSPTTYAPMTDATRLRHRLNHVQAILNTTTDHLDEGDVERAALMRALGLLEQAFADLDDLEAAVDDVDTETVGT